MATYLKYLPVNPLVVEGYAPAATVAERFRLSRRRAGIVREYMLGRYDLPPQNTGFIGLGEEAAGSPDKDRWDGVSLTLFLDRASAAVRANDGDRASVAPVLEARYAGSMKGRACERLSSDGGGCNGRRADRRGARVTSSLPTRASRCATGSSRPWTICAQEFARFQRTIEKVGEMANDGIRVVNEFNAARAQSSFAQTRHVALTGATI